MKKIFIIVFIMALLGLSKGVVHAQNGYHDFEEMSGPPGMLLADLDEQKLSQELKKMQKFKMSGWITKDLNRNFRVDFRSKTIYSFYNDGYTPINYQYKSESKMVDKLHLSVTGTLGVEYDYKGAFFKSGLNAKLSMTKKQDNTKEFKENINVDLKADPGTQVELYVLGHGIVSNGYAIKYKFFSLVEAGAFEYILVANQYYRIEKTKI